MPACSCSVTANVSRAWPQQWQTGHIVDDDRVAENVLEVARDGQRVHAGDRAARHIGHAAQAVQPALLSHNADHRHHHAPCQRHRAQLLVELLRRRQIRLGCGA